MLSMEAHPSIISQFGVDIDAVFDGIEGVTIALPMSDISCPVCMAVTANPRLTMCGHRICMNCANRIIITQASENENPTIKCPTCSMVNSAQTIPDHRTRDIIMSQSVVCGHAGCSQRCDLRDVLTHMKRCKFRENERSLLNSAVKRCRSEIDISDEDTDSKRRRYREVHKVVTTFNNEISQSVFLNPATTSIEQTVDNFMSGLRQIVGNKTFRRLYQEECTNYHQALINTVKAATSA